jgi:hypothetical protein
MEQETQNPPDSRVWDNRATEVVAEARKMPLGEIGDARRLEKRGVCALPPRLTDGWRINRLASFRQRCSVWQ